MANSSPVRSLMFAFDASKTVKATISAAVIGAPLALPKAASIAARRLASGMIPVMEPDRTVTALELEQLFPVSDSPDT